MNYFIYTFHPISPHPRFSPKILLQNGNMDRESVTTPINSLVSDSISDLERNMWVMRDLINRQHVYLHCMIQVYHHFFLLCYYFSMLILFSRFLEKKENKRSCMDHKTQKVWLVQNNQIVKTEQRRGCPLL